MIKLEEKLYTSTEVSQILGVSLRSVYRYIEEGKLNAEVKTATGRHRFTKQNILDFLYPNGEPVDLGEYSPQPSVTKPTTDVSKKVKEQKISPVVETTDEEEDTEESAEESTKVTDEVTSRPKETSAKKVQVEEPEEEQVDWLAKFREAASRLQQEEKGRVKGKGEELVGLTDVFGGEEKTASEEKITFAYYRSTLGGLKEIAQNLDKSARSGEVDYAFTLNAGLSLHKPIKPFSLLHAYVKSADQAFFEKMLALSPCDETSAQLCLIVDSNPDIYSSREELHGLYVVSKEQLKKDVNTYGDVSLREDLKSIIG